LAIVSPSPAPGADWLALSPRANGSKMRELVRRHAGPRVLDLDLRQLALVADAEHDLAFGGELDRVAQQVDEDLPHSLLVGAHDLGQGAFDVEPEGQALGGCLQFEQARHLVHQVREAHRLDVQCELARLDARDVERAFDQ
jgi:hypothetical protein